MNIISIKLKRNMQQLDAFDSKAIRGEILISYTNESNQFRLTRIKTLENYDYLCPDGTYSIEYEKSPKFSRNLWELKNVPNRSEIKIHVGNRSAHSKGCILVSHDGLNKLHRTLSNFKHLQIQIQTL
jgi:hypothetical protein